MRDVIRQSTWDLDVEPLVSLQSALSNALQFCCSKARPSSQVRATWPQKASLLLAETRNSGRQALASATENDFLPFKYFTQEFKK
ncbi:putative zinc knuckle domain protein [Golovinomyces cichoracearum]|uniref:Putative zinc knuckle domain protein n=1 Tax=Golovinomyces cichoracearum TaxID=62708 RepID=A0A420ISN3_9PEZI|nr:putative zinc knuckle domain protein [Golovinomyces cichoracearum]